MGGPARYLAGKKGCQVLAIEIQSDLHQTGAELTQRTGLDKRVTHVHGDILALAPHFQGGSYDAMVSWLTVLRASHV